MDSVLWKATAVLWKWPKKLHWAVTDVTSCSVALLNRIRKTICINGTALQFGGRKGKEFRSLKVSQCLSGDCGLPAWAKNELAQFIEITTRSPAPSHLPWPSFSMVFPWCTLSLESLIVPQVAFKQVLTFTHGPVPFFLFRACDSGLWSDLRPRVK